MSTKRMLAAVAAAGVVAAGGGSAFTASNTVPATVAGYGTSTISGATANSIVYGFNSDSTQITSATVVFAGNLTGKNVKAGFGTGASTACTLAAHDATANTTTATCGTFAQDTAAASAFNVAVG